MRKQHKTAGKLSFLGILVEKICSEEFFLDQNELVCQFSAFAPVQVLRNSNRTIDVPQAKRGLGGTEKYAQVQIF